MGVDVGVGGVLGLGDERPKICAYTTRLAMGRRRGDNGDGVLIRLCFAGNTALCALPIFIDPTASQNATIVVFPA